MNQNGTSERVRRQAFLNELSALQDRYGYQVGAQLDTVVEKLGTAALVKPVAQLMLTPYPDWEPTSGNGTDPAVTVTPTDPTVIPEIVSEAGGAREPIELNRYASGEPAE